jgi:hypothetical protein
MFEAFLHREHVMAALSTRNKIEAGLAGALVVSVIALCAWTNVQVGGLKTEQMAQSRRIDEALAAAQRSAAVAAAPAALPAWGEQISQIRSETQAEAARLQDQITRNKDLAQTQLAGLRDEFRTELAGLRKQIYAPTASEDAVVARARQDNLLKDVREQVLALDRRTRALASLLRPGKTRRGAVRYARAMQEIRRERAPAVVPAAPARSPVPPTSSLISPPASGWSAATFDRSPKADATKAVEASARLHETRSSVALAGESEAAQREADAKFVVRDRRVMRSIRSICNGC